MKIVALIPARYGATRFPGKLMQKLGSKTVITTTYEATLNSDLFSEVFVVPTVMKSLKRYNPMEEKQLKANEFMKVEQTE